MENNSEPIADSLAVPQWGQGASAFPGDSSLFPAPAENGATDFA